ncbi:hypothetical protein SAMD00019534_062480 [Acytostelium subglobosum LB1]|uniref:hypothetical protein n=1 Tax=Acytostelium subglobosum LB1 TaxID=1410327 RepID=UPI0006449BFE|nr:hypothetical protein SAMD00019534_062480 [Acytostelium subglobosum LB1]GAM23073.1 hypothetical protein SAMD00019534_062480 [Acytostelium subglobosum LB1]|eukprot:XP_012754300.1 hypothetical protein SAMD00019534_062480 [Acytostelium subglobosum LB1]
MDVPIPFEKKSTDHWFRQRVAYSEEAINEAQKEAGLASNIFKDVRVYFDGHTDQISLIHLKKLVLSHGGTHSHFITSSCTHIVGSAMSLSKVEQMERRKRSKKRLSFQQGKTVAVHYIHPNWILDCCRQIKRLSEDSYSLFKTTTMNSNDIRSYLVSGSGNGGVGDGGANSKDSAQQENKNKKKKRPFGHEDYLLMNEISEYDLVSHLKRKRVFGVDDNDDDDDDNVNEDHYDIGDDGQGQQQQDDFETIFYQPKYSSVDFMKKEWRTKDAVEDGNAHGNDDNDEEPIMPVLTPLPTQVKRLPRGQSKGL